MDPPEPIAGSTQYKTVKRLPTGIDFLEVGDVAARVTADGEAIAPGEQTAQTMALLGIDTQLLDRLWGDLVLEVSPRVTGLAVEPRIDEYALYHQAETGWQVEVDIAHDPKHVLAIADLAYVNPYTANRTVTISANEWNVAPDPHDLAAGRVATVVTRQVELEPGAAVGVVYSGVSEDEITATVRAAAATHRARRDLETALHEMEVAIKVANDAWEGDLAETIRDGLVRKHRVISMITDVVTQWDELLHDVIIPQQRKAKEADEDLRNEVLATVGVGILLAPISFGVGTVARGLAFIGRVGVIAKRLEDVRKLISVKILERAAAVTKSQRAMSALLHSARIAARSAGDLTATAAIRTAQDKPITGEDVLFSLFLGSVLHGTSEVTGALLKEFTKASKIKLRDDVAGAVKGAKQEQMRAPFRAVHASATEASLGSVLIAGAAGIPGEAVKNVFTQRLKKTVLEALKRDPAARRAAEAVAARRLAAGQVGKDKATLVNEELAAMAGRRVDPVSDYLFGTTVGGISKSASAPLNDRAAQAQASAPTGTVAQPVPGS